MRTSLARLFRPAILLIVSLSLCGVMHAAPTSPAASAIRQVLDEQVAAWNRGDIPAFMQGYDHSPDLQFVGKSVVHGYDAVLDNYKKNYGHGEAMGKLTFSDLEITPIDAQVATVTGHFHLTRTTAGGGDAQGIFSLVFRHTAAGWRIVLDHTS